MTEFGDSVPYAMTEFYRGGPKVADIVVNNSVPTAGRLKLTDFYGTRKRQLITISSTVTNYNLYNSFVQLFGIPTSPIAVKLTITSSGTVGATSISNAALDVGSGFPSGSFIEIDNAGKIWGAGGLGGAGELSNGGGAGSGQNGGDAIKATYTGITVKVTNAGELKAGGGGGAGGLKGANGINGNNGYSNTTGLYVWPYTTSNYVYVEPAIFGVGFTVKVYNNGQLSTLYYGFSEPDITTMQQTYGYDASYGPLFYFVTWEPGNDKVYRRGSLQESGTYQSGYAGMFVQTFYKFQLVLAAPTSGGVGGLGGQGGTGGTGWGFNNQSSTAGFPGSNGQPGGAGGGGSATAGQSGSPGQTGADGGAAGGNGINQGVAVGGVAGYAINGLGSYDVTVVNNSGTIVGR